MIAIPGSAGGPPGHGDPCPAPSAWAPVAQGGSADVPRSWDWEGLRANGKLHLFCYFGGRVVALAPFDSDG